MDKVEKDIAYYERRGDILEVKRCFAEKCTITDLVKNFVRNRQQREVELANAPLIRYNVGDTTVVTSKEEGST